MLSVRGRRGQVKLGVVGAIIGVVAVLLLVAYFLSDPFRTGVNRQYKDFTEWTPERIAKNPILYMDFAEEQVKETIVQLKASEIAIAQNRATLEKMRDGSETKVRVGTQHLDELKQKFVEARDSGTFPVQWAGKSLDESAMKRQIVTLHREIESQQGILDKAGQGIKKLDNEKNKILDKFAECEEQVAKIATNREMLKVQKITEDLAQQLAQIGSVVASAVDTVSDSESVVTLSDLAADSEAGIDDAEFEEILKQ